MRATKSMAKRNKTIFEAIREKEKEERIKREKEKEKK